MPSPIRFTCSVLGSDWERKVWAQHPGPATRVFAADYHVPAWRVVKLTWVIPSGKYKGRHREAHYLIQQGGTTNPYHLRPNDEALQDKPLPEPGA